MSYHPVLKLFHQLKISISIVIFCLIQKKNQVLSFTCDYSPDKAKEISQPSTPQIRVRN